MEGLLDLALQYAMPELAAVTAMALASRRAS